jgi:hypothetical protein
MAYKDPEAKKAYDKAYRAANKGRKAAWLKAWKEANKARVAACNRAWRAANREKVSAYDRTHGAAYYEAHKDERRAYNMSRHPEKYRKAYDPNRRPFPATLDWPAAGSADRQLS